MTRSATARLSGLLYLATLPTAGFAYGYVAFMPTDDAAALLAPAGRVAADLLVLFVAASVPLSLAALAQRMELMALIDASQLAALDAKRLLRAEANLFQFASIFWGLWMMPLGWLSYRSGLVPRVIGIGLIAGGFGYLASFVLPVLGVEAPAALAGVLMAVTLVSEFAFIFWLIVKGSGKEAPTPAASGAV